jgi:uncharacterized protein YdeI (YjbR/CyaY-like superfamily)
MNPQVDDFIAKAKKRQEEMSQLRMILIHCGLTEEYKWKQPCYTFQKKNVAIIAAFKGYFALSFFQGALLKDHTGVLIQPGDNSQAARQIRFENVREIIKLEPLVRKYVQEAKALVEEGAQIDFKEKTELVFPDDNPEIKAAFYALTPGRQRGYNLHFSAPKQSATKISRIESSIPRILKGKGFHDCICGKSKRMPTCDGSHKYL